MVGAGKLALLAPILKNKKLKLKDISMKLLINNSKYCEDMRLL